MPADQLSATLRGYRDRDAAVALGGLRGPRDVPRLLAAVEAVLALHVKATRYLGDGIAQFDYCRACPGQPAWPCPEVRAIAGPWRLSSEPG